MRFKKDQAASPGFTIIELLIVVVVIAILAAITIVAYNGITKKAVDTSLKSDLQNTATKLEVTTEQSGSGSYPDTQQEVDVAQSKNNIVSYTKKAYGYCISASNPQASTSYAFRSNTKTIEEGNCDVNVSNFAGTGTSGFADGAGAQAQFTQPAGIVSGSDGSVYVSSNNRIRKITTDGTVSTLAGSGTSGNANGSATSAQFTQPGKISLDKTDTLYVSDVTSHTVRKVDTATGTVSAFTGTPASCNYGRGSLIDGTATTARHDRPSSVTVNSAGIFYITEAGSQRVREALPDGSLTTYAGSGTLNACTASSAQAGSANGARLSAMFAGMSDIIADKNDTLYITDSGNNIVRTISSNGIVANYGSMINLPKAITIDSQGTLYVASSHAIYTITSTGLTTIFAGSTSAGYVNGVGTAARFNNISDITLSADQTAMFVADSTNNRIRKISL